VLSLGYAEGPPAEMSSATLVGQSTVGLADLMEDIHVTEDLTGFRHYLTNGLVTLVNDFVRMHASMEDHDAPVWTSTWNDHAATPAVEATPRVGIQDASGGGGTITVRWDVALDQHRVRYALYAQAAPFDFQADPHLQGARRIVLSPRVPAAYVMGVGPAAFAYEAAVSGFHPGETQQLVIRAFDDSPSANEDTNTVVLTATP
jgi:hypothetical protein